VVQCGSNNDQIPVDRLVYDSFLTTLQNKGVQCIPSAEVVSDEELSSDYIIPSGFNRKVAERIAAGVTRASAKAMSHDGFRRSRRSGVGLEFSGAS
jgi:hypothetical protein